MERAECPFCEVYIDYDKWLESIVDDMYECPVCKTGCTPDEIDSQVSCVDTITK